MRKSIDVPISLRIFLFLYQRKGKKFSAEKLAFTFECSIRTIMRHVDILTIAGIPVQLKRGAGGGIWLEQSYEID